MALLAALVAGVGAVAAKGPASLTQDAIALYSGEGAQQGFGLRNRNGDRASIGVVRDQLTNANGKAVGKHHWQCLSSSLASYCTGAIVLSDAAQTGAGTIIFAGIFEGFNGESLAVTGGTGSYAGARGTMVLKVEDGRFVRVVKLIQ